ncbi:MAG: LLM class F420-dependent oxidoreductase [Betaproteobacteria bacterium]|nr:LLM class F420-dependent oxidoreductase [Betaproteobacteria bacterium]
MKLGVALPQLAIGGDPLIVKDFAQAAEEIGFQHLSVYDHVLGVNTGVRTDGKSRYNSSITFHDPFVLFGFLAGFTKRITFTTQILILPQRQTVLVAKQAACVDYLSGGRLRLGIGVGWNQPEYAALGENFHDRGARSEEQIALMKALWTDPNVSFKGKWHAVKESGLNPLPVQRPIPIWFGGHVDQTMDRIVRMGDGWILLQYKPDAEGRAAINKLRELAKKAGRAADSVGTDTWVSMANTTPEQWRAEIKAWRDIGVSHVTLNTAFDRYHHQPILEKSPRIHVDAVRRYFDAVHDLL